MLGTSIEIANLVGRCTGVRAVLIQGRNGGWGDAQGSSRGLSNSEDLRWLLGNRLTADAVLVSYGTAVREHYRVWRPVGGLAGFRANLELPTEVPLVVVTDDAERAVAGRKFATLVTGTAEAISSCRSAGYEHIVCEGGPRLVEALAAAGQLDEIALTTSAVDATEMLDTPALSRWLDQTRTLQDFTSSGFRYQLLAADDAENPGHGQRDTNVLHPQ